MASECPLDRMTDEQRAELASGERKMLMNVEEEMEQEEGVNMMSIMLLNKTAKPLQRNGLSDDRLYLNNYSTVIAVKNKDFLKNMRNADQHISVSCNAGVGKAHQLGDLGDMESWYMPNRIANILLQHQMEQKYQITYDSWEGYYVVHHPKGPVRFCKDHQGLPYINMGKSSRCSHPTSADGAWELR